MMSYWTASCSLLMKGNLYLLMHSNGALDESGLRLNCVGRYRSFFAFTIYWNGRAKTGESSPIKSEEKSWKNGWGSNRRIARSCCLSRYLFQTGQTYPNSAM